MAKVYGVKLGGKLWVAGNAYGFYQSTTEKIENAKFYLTEQEAQRAAKKTIGGKVKVINISEEQEQINDIDMLRASNIQLQRERDAALNELNLYKLNNHVEKKEVLEFE